jgi:hypothetical protein
VPKSVARTFGAGEGVIAWVLVNLDGQAQAVVVDPDLDPRVGRTRDHLDVAGPHLGLEPVLDRVLHQRLQQHRRHGSAFERRGQLQSPTQPRPHAQRHDLQVGAQLRELPAKRHRLGLRRRQRAAQVDDEPVDHGLGAIRVLAHQPAQIGQGVEEHVRLELRAQQAKLRLDRQALCLGS